MSGFHVAHRIVLWRCRASYAARPAWRKAFGLNSQVFTAVRHNLCSRLLACAFVQASSTRQHENVRPNGARSNQERSSANSDDDNNDSRHNDGSLDNHPNNFLAFLHNSSSTERQARQKRAPRAAPAVVQNVDVDSRSRNRQTRLQTSTTKTSTTTNNNDDDLNT